jgi:hypothetical protein
MLQQPEPVASLPDPDLILPFTEQDVELATKEYVVLFLQAFVEISDLVNFYCCAFFVAMFWFIGSAKKKIVCFRKHFYFFVVF